MKDGSNKEQDIQPMMILTIDIGNGHVDKLQIFDLNNIEQETYDFCVKNKLDFNTMQEINTQIQNVLKDKQLEEEQEISNVFQEIKEEEDEKITENNINEIREQESIIITNSNEMDTQKGNKNDIIKEKENNINKNEINKMENENMNSINSNGNGNCNGLNIKKNINQSIRTNSTISNGNETKKIKKTNKHKKKNIKENIKEAIAMAKEKTKQNKQQNKENNNKNKIYNNFYKMITNKKKENNGFEENIIKKEEYNNINNINNVNNINKISIDNNENNNEENKKENIEINEEEIEVEGKAIEEKQINNDINQNQNQILSDNLNSLDKKEEEASPIIENKIIKDNSNFNSNRQEIEKNDELGKNKDNNEDININNNITNNIIMKEDNNINNSKENQNNKKKNRSNNESNISDYNPGKELYERGIKFKESEKEKLEALKKNLEDDEEEDNTFIPKINKLSDIQMERIREKRLECTNPDIINNYKEYKEAKMEILKKKTDEEFNKIYTFKPCINRSYSTSKVQKNRMKEKDNENNINEMETRFDKLYNYRIDYQENKDKLKEKIYNKYSFKPRINENSNFYKLKKPFNERLQTYSNKSRENMAKIQKVYEKELGYDEPFKPQLNHKKNKSLLKDRDEFFINEAQKYNTNSNNNVGSNNNYIDPYTKLYLYGKKYQQDKNFMAEKYYQDQIKSPQFCQSTEDIINKKKEKSFKQIFKLLDGDEDSKISSTHINTSKLPKNILRILEPILNELKEENESLNEIEFIFVCEQLYLSLPWNERRELRTFEEEAKKNLKKEKIIKEKNNFSFKPRINKRNYSFENQTILTNNNTDLTSNINYNEIFNNKNQSYITNSYKNYNNYYMNRKINEISNEKNKENKTKNGKNQINNRVNYFNFRITNKNNGKNFVKNNYNENNHLNVNSKSNVNKDKYSILKNVDINFIGNNSNNNKTEKKSKVVEKKINYENFVNV